MSPEYTGRLHAALGTLGVKVETLEERQGGWLTGREGVCKNFRQGPTYDNLARVMGLCVAAQLACEEIDPDDQADLMALAHTLSDLQADLAAHAQAQLSGDDLDLGLSCVIYTLEDHWSGDALPEGLTLPDLLVTVPSLHLMLLRLQTEPEAPLQVRA